MSSVVAYVLRVSFGICFLWSGLEVRAVGIGGGRVVNLRVRLHDQSPSISQPALTSAKSGCCRRP